MRYLLFVSYVTDDKHGVFSWALSNYKGIVASDQYFAQVMPRMTQLASAISDFEKRCVR